MIQQILIYFILILKQDEIKWTETPFCLQQPYFPSIPVLLLWNVNRLSGHLFTLPPLRQIKTLLPNNHPLHPSEMVLDLCVCVSVCVCTPVWVHACVCACACVHVAQSISKMARQSGKWSPISEDIITHGSSLRPHSVQLRMELETQKPARHTVCVCVCVCACVYVCVCVWSAQVVALNIIINNNNNINIIIYIRYL